ncbi:hypothetical protein Hanom_Chr14g01252421 [Helianthus anomalus]
MRLLSNMPSSIISSHSMHLGMLATASHAIATGTLFSVFYKPWYSLNVVFFQLGSSNMFNPLLLMC